MSSKPTAAALAVAVAIAVGAAVITTSSDGAGPRPRITPADTFPHTPVGAVAAATAWCQLANAALIYGGSVTALINRSGRALAELMDRTAAVFHRFITATHAPYLARFWPLGYAVQQYSSASARIRVWQAYAVAVGARADLSGFQTTTVSLAWIHGAWKVTAAPGGPDLPPPHQGATASQVASWMSAVGQLSQYSYAP